MYMLEQTLFNLAVEVPTSFASKHRLTHSQQPDDFPSDTPLQKSLQPRTVHIKASLGKFQIIFHT